MAYKGEWQQCPSYDQGDIVTRNGHLWEAIQQNAGKDPNGPQGNLYWTDLGVFTAAGTVPHDSTLDKSGTSETEFFHLSEDEAAAALNSHKPGADNPFVTQKQIPEFEISLSPFTEIPLPEDFGMVYAAAARERTAAQTGGEPIKEILAAGDNKIALLDVSTETWSVFPLPGKWRAVCRHDTGEWAGWVLAGKDVIAAGSAPEDIDLRSAAAGEWKSVASDGNIVVVTGPGRAAVTSEPEGAWTAYNTQPGYGEGLAWNETGLLFHNVGRAGLATSPDGVTWTPDVTFPEGTWRTILRGDEQMIAISGKEAHKYDEDASIPAGETEGWNVTELPAGGWLGGAAASGFVIAVADGKIIKHRDRVREVVRVTDIPDYVYACAVYCAGRFWAFGSGAVRSVVTNIGEALAAAAGANADNRFATTADVGEAEARAQAALEEAVTQIGADIQTAKTETLAQAAGRGRR